MTDESGLPNSDRTVAPLNIETLDRYLAGESPRAEAEAVHHWLSVAPQGMRPDDVARALRRPPTLRGVLSQEMEADWAATGDPQ